MRLRQRSTILFKLLILLSMILPSQLYGGYRINPKDIIKDPNLARLNHNRSSLTKQELEEIDKYGYTGLEIMTYVDSNAMPGKDSDYTQYIIQRNSWGHVTERKSLNKRKYYFKDYRALFSHDGIKIGDIEYKQHWLNFYPPRSKGQGGINRHYVRGDGFDKIEDGWWWNVKLRKISKITTRERTDSYINSDVTLDDLGYREPWEENHRIFGIDQFKGHGSFVIESINKNPDHYLSKRVVWVDKENFLDLHIEEYNRKGQLFKVWDKDWVRVKPWNYFVAQVWDVYNVITKYRTIILYYDWIFDQGFSEREFSQRILPKEDLWRIPKDPPVAAKDLLAQPLPRVKADFIPRLYR